MKPASEALKYYINKHCCSCGRAFSKCPNCNALYNDINQFVMTERERCAKLADKELMRKLAQAIRGGE